MFEIARLGGFEWNLGDDSVAPSGRTLEIFGFSPGEGRHAADYFGRIHPDDAERVRAAVENTARGTGHLDVEYRIHLPDGSVRHIWSVSQLVTSDDGAKTQVGVFRDMSSRRQIEEALRDSEAKLAAITDFVDQMIWSTRPDGYHDFYNSRWYEFTGVPAGSTDGEAWNGMFHEDDRVRAWETWRKSLSTGEPYHIEYRLRHRSGEYRWVLGRAKCTRDENGQILRWFGTCTDIDDLKKDQARQRFVLDLHDALRFEDDPVAVTSIAAERLGKHVQVPRAGYGEVDETGQFVTVYKDWISDGSVMSLSGESRLLDGFGPAVVACLKHGKTLVVEDCYVDERAGPEYAINWDSIGCRALIVVPLLKQGRLRALLYLHDTRPRAWRSDDIALAENIAHRTWDAVERVRAERQVREFNETLERRVQERSAELEKTQQALRQAQKLEAIGQLTGGVAHDFNNLLTPIVGGLDILQKRGSFDQKAKRLLDAAVAASERARVLVQRLLAFARRQPLATGPVDIGQLVRDMMDLLQSTVGPRISVVVDIAADVPPAAADANQFELALLNLAVNARDAMPAGGELSVRVTAVHVSGHDHALAAGDYVVVAVADTGAGMDDATVSRAVEPFFSTKGVGKGTGLGLSMVHGLMAQLGGALRISSAIGVGSNFQMFIPVSAGEVAIMRPAPGLLEGGSGPILIVDDDEVVRTATAEMIAELGYDALAVESGVAALDVLRTGRRPKLVLTDHLMMNMTGAELALAVRRDFSGVPVLIMTGFSDAKDLPADVPRLLKPFRLSDLAQEINILCQSVSSG